MTSNSPISRFENFARYLIEGSFDRLLRQPGPLSEVAAGLAEAAEKSQHNGLTANVYTVSVHPGTLAELQERSADIPTLMEAMLIRYGEQNRMVFSGDLEVRFVANPSVEMGRAAVVAQRDQLDEEPTAVLRRVAPRRDSSTGKPPGDQSVQEKVRTAPLKMTEAYLIVNGRRHVVLDKAVNSVGRSLDNDIVLEEPGVSRTHAQIRWRNGQFEIFDLGSRAGTQVNGRPLARGVLKSGDVITLGSAAMIYGEEDQAEDTGRSAAKSAAVDITQELTVDDSL